MITLHRETVLCDRIIGRITLPDGSSHMTMELLWNDNKVGESCIPVGIYKFMRDTDGRFQWFKVLDVEGRTNIEMHLGNRPSHSQGCIIMTKKCLLAMKNEFFSDLRLKYVLEIKD